MRLVADTAELAQLCARAANSSFVTVDTEFLRDRTYWPRLCLVQVADEQGAFAIDSMAPEIDLGPLYALMDDAAVLKVFHAARQDIEIFFHRLGRVPAPIYDTQVAAMVCGFGDSVGYETLVGQFAGVGLDKSMRFTDWARRPLDDRQIDYALADVIHLRKVYTKLAERIAASGRAEWVTEEMATLIAPATYALDPRTAWLRIKSRSNRPRYLAVLRELAAWREIEAQHRDVPRGRVLKDETLVDIAAAAPQSEADLRRLRSAGRDQVGAASVAGILGAIATARALPADSCPVPNDRPPQSAKLGPAIELLKVLLRIRCESYGVAQKLVASSDDIEAIARDDGADIPALHGWRHQVFGEDAIRLKQGTIALACEGQRLKVVSLGG